MLNFYTYNDFVGKINLDLGDSNVKSQFDSFADDIGEECLRALLDDDLYQQLIDDLDGNGNPLSANFVNLVDGLDYERPNGKTVHYDGLKEMLRYFVYAAWLEDNWSSNSSTGQEVSLSENAKKVNRSNLRKEWSKRYNEAIMLYFKAFRYINDNYTTYFTSGTNEYAFWDPKELTFEGVITMRTPRNSYFFNRSSNGN